MNIDLGKFRGPCPCGRAHSISVEEIVIEAGALQKIPSWVAGKGFKKPAMLCDFHTYEAAGAALEKLMPGLPAVKLDPEGLHADERAAALADERLGDADLILAVGSGTIHDTARFIAHKRGIPFLSAPTAASVDGFVSTVAAMTWHGYKKTFPAVAPAAVFADTNVFAKAPARLSASGFADLLGKYTALADWKAAHLLTGEYFCGRICEMELSAIETVCKNLDGIPAGGPEASEQLMYGLLLSGLAMQMIGNSRPASGAEHHFSHLWEMEAINPHVKAYHGEKVGVGLMLTAESYHKLAAWIENGGSRLSDYGGVETALFAHFKEPDVYKQIAEENTPDPLAQVDRQTLQQNLPALAKILREIPNAENIAALLKKAGAPVTMADIGLSDGLIPLSAALSPYVRSRLTVMRISKLLDCGSL